VTDLPSISVPACICDIWISEVSDCDIVFMVCTCDNVAVCCMNVEVSTGELGSWYFSCATSSCRNACGSSVDMVDEVVPSVPEVGAVDETVPVAAVVA
jgi:hypothetical protein